MFQKLRKSIKRSAVEPSKKAASKSSVLKTEEASTFNTKKRSIFRPVGVNKTYNDRHQRANEGVVALAPTLTLSHDDDDECELEIGGHCQLLLSSSFTTNDVSFVDPKEGSSEKKAEMQSSQQATSSSSSSSSHYTFTDKDLMANELNHMRALAAQQSEISKLQQGHEELTHVLAHKAAELAYCQVELNDKNKELATCYQELSLLDDESRATKLELSDTKEQLNMVSRTLMQCQAELHEKESRGFAWPW